MEKANQLRANSDHQAASQQSGGLKDAASVETGALENVLQRVHQAADTSPSMAAQRKLASLIDGSPRQTLQRERLAGLSAAADQQAIQRKIQIRGKDADLGSLLAKAHDMKERVVLANWDWTDTLHNFEGRTKLWEAVAAATGQVADLPSLYQPENLKFLTKGEGRLPTLYFVSGETSGRIRQQHGSGPAVISQEGKKDFFFSDQTKMREFGAAVKLDPATDPADYSGSTVPAQGNFHYEVTFDGGRVKKTHPSGGTIDLDTSSYDLAKITTIYMQAIGRST